ncbi:protein of unknown function (DUF4350) [Schinkia azotoformans MEV2011]|uniref:DUF4350 domain-containing protein n=1 Tax=Schinkia azotoformans MEV2011 TaxID=1348973 RepID=A0A072NHA5_SCHAZ|nr:DUF4350 domain-containing protein [Schinkia azotoformans]KEF37074.1 protein of unknown function (DUF4350) [Schinkia azotoformans MEV2011]MEC1697697.1 DUF4350 domain-containing protein [Schinkia azotoformans]MEC1718672.1 DUF4350 domain-containing protein [Schinkia azotoformans]MEC1727445.1 DUF4350 domain-containing protein [Schinkia azotoformans]MEC1739341.1 DUF4350 domain-containing protein [Schinkia azotoformans]
MQIATAKKRTWLGLIMLLLLFFLSSHFVLTPEPSEYPSYASNSPAPNGVKAFYTYLEKEKLPVKRWFYSADLLPKNDGNQLLMMIEPKKMYFPNKAEQKSYEEFMKAGNSIILFTKKPQGIFNFKKENDEEILLSNDDGPIAIKRSFGKGQLIVANNPESLTNENILMHDHIPLMISLLNAVDIKNAGAIWIDEYTHGFGKTASSVYPKWLLLLSVQAAILIGLWLWLEGKRFGPILRPREEFVRFTDERIQALAAWYMRCQLYKDSLFIQADYLKFVLQERWGVPYKTDWNDSGDVLERKWVTRSAQEIRQFLHDLTLVLKKENISKQEYLLWSKKLEQLRKEVEEE